MVLHGMLCSVLAFRQLLFAGDANAQLVLCAGFAL